jgi:hypothetical protein
VGARVWGREGQGEEREGAKMIAIINKGPHTNDIGGERNYEVRINNKVICTFKHKRTNGLAVCLMEAAKAVEKTRWAKFANEIGMEGLAQ